MSLVYLYIMATLYIMCGLAFSGKSTLSKRITEYTHSELVGYDAVFHEKKPELDLNMDKVDEWKSLTKVVQEKIRESLNKNISVVYDNTNARYEHREALRTIAKECGVNSVVVYVNTPLSVIREREQRNKSTMERHKVKEEDFNNVLDQFQKPQAGENVIEYTPEMALDEWLESLPS